jgi:hypothetical protein
MFNTKDTKDTKDTKGRERSEKQRGFAALLPCLPFPFVFFVSLVSFVLNPNAGRPSPAYRSDRTAFTMSSRVGTTASSSGALIGIGVCLPASRTGGPSR